MDFKFSNFLVVSSSAWEDARNTITVSGAQLFNVDTLTPVIAGSRCVAYAKISRVQYSSTSTTVEFKKVRINEDTAKAIYNLYRNQTGSGQDAMNSGDYSSMAPIGSFQRKSKASFDDDDDDGSFGSRGGRKRFDL